MSRIVLAILLQGILSVGLLAAEPAQNKTVQQPDDVEKLITSGLKNYKGGNTPQAIADLQKAVALMQKSINQGLAGFFPAVPAGWQTDEIESQALALGSAQGSGSWTMVSRTYTRQADDLRINLAMTNSPDLVANQQAAAEAYRNPMTLQMLNQDPNTKVEIIDQDGWFGWMVTSKGQSASITAFCHGCLLTVEASGDDADAVKTFWNAINLKGLAAAQPASTTKEAPQ